MRTPLITLAAIPLLLVACAAPNTIDVPSAMSSISASALASATAPSGLVGKWIGVRDCGLIVEALRAGGFEESVVIEAVVGNALVPGATSVSDLADPADPCADAVPREHGHFFTADGGFGSTDHNGQQVDDGTYTVADDSTVTINGTEFGYTISGQTLTLRSLAPQGCVTFECGLSIMVAMAGEPLERSR